MRVLIVEDEIRISEGIEKLLHKIDTTQRELETLARLNAGESADDQRLA